ncbi:MAG: Vitamin B12 dependent methionine synthase activation subunit [Clostridia bacterium]|nr:Vitamin B12 dependent methionine synthase activation subunit [Clostridia bacterium]
MNSAVIYKSYGPPPFSVKEALRYAGCAKTDSELEALVEQCLSEVWDSLSYRVCYRLLPLEVEGELCRVGDTCFRSRALGAQLEGYSHVIVFAATVGAMLDRAIARYSRIAPSRALILQGIGAERAEALCDAFQADMEGELGVSLGRRFSPGYGDLPLETQRQVFELLGGCRSIGLSLNDSLLMSPSKSVTALVGAGRRSGGA